MRKIALELIALSSALALAACAKAVESRHQIISPRGTSIFNVETHSSALNNSIDFYVQEPGKDRVLVGRGSDLEYAGQVYDPKRRIIYLLTPDASQIEIVAPRVGSYLVGRAAIHVRQDEQAQLDAWDPAKPGATVWMLSHIRPS